MGSVKSRGSKTWDSNKGGLMVQQGKMLKDMSVTELKALAFDLIAQREQNGLQLQEVTKMIQQELIKPVEQPKDNNGK